VQRSIEDEAVAAGTTGTGSVRPPASGRLRRLVSLLADRRFLSLVAAAGLLLLFFLLHERLREYLALGYLGAFLVGAVGSGTVFFPAPAALVVFALGGTEGYWPPLVGLAAAAGETLGELTGYLAGSAGRGVVTKGRFGRWLQSLFERWGGPLLFVVSAVPNPLFDVIGVAAGAAGYPLWRFLLIVFAGKVLKDTAIAVAGSLGLRFALGLLDGL